MLLYEILFPAVQYYENVDSHLLDQRWQGQEGIRLCDIVFPARVALHAVFHERDRVAHEQTKDH